MPATSAADSTAYLARYIRREAVKMAYESGGAHLASCLSVADLLAVLYVHVPLERIIVSKGHAAMAVYAALAGIGFMPEADLRTYCKPGSKLLGHVSHEVPGVAFSTGSLGHGLPVACGLALATQEPVYVVLSDAELDCGTTYEAINVIERENLPVKVFVDWNGWQALRRTALPSFARHNPLVGRIDGHNHAEITRAIQSNEDDDALFFLAGTVKGKGVSFMEDTNEFHYRAPTQDEVVRALAEIGS